MNPISRSRPIDIPRVNAPHAEAPSAQPLSFLEIAPPFEPMISAQILEMNLRTQRTERPQHMEQGSPRLRIVTPSIQRVQRTKLQKFGAVLAAIGASLFIPALTVMAMALPVGAAILGACVIAFTAGIACLYKAPQQTGDQQDNSGNP